VVVHTYGHNGIDVSSHAGTNYCSQRRKKVCVKAMRASAYSAKVEKGQVKLQHRHNTLLYYASSRNQSNAKQLELVSNSMPLLSCELGSDASNKPTSVFVLHVVAKPLGDSAVVAGTPTSSMDARHEGHVGFIIISSTSKDGGA
jgi:hypothetical protein